MMEDRIEKIYTYFTMPHTAEIGTTSQINYTLIIKKNTKGGILVKIKDDINLGGRVITLLKQNA